MVTEGVAVVWIPACAGMTGWGELRGGVICGMCIGNFVVIEGVVVVWIPSCAGMTILVVLSA